MAVVKDLRDFKFAFVTNKRKDSYFSYVYGFSECTGPKRWSGRDLCVRYVRFWH